MAQLEALFDMFPSLEPTIVSSVWHSIPESDTKAEAVIDKLMQLQEEEAPKRPSESFDDQMQRAMRESERQHNMGRPNHGSGSGRHGLQRHGSQRQQPQPARQPAQTTSGAGPRENASAGWWQEDDKQIGGSSLAQAQRLQRQTLHNSIQRDQPTPPPPKPQPKQTPKPEPKPAPAREPEPAKDRHRTPPPPPPPQPPAPEPNRESDSDQGFDSSSPRDDDDHDRRGEKQKGRRERAKHSWFNPVSWLRHRHDDEEEEEHQGHHRHRPSGRSDHPPEDRPERNHPRKDSPAGHEHQPKGKDPHAIHLSAPKRDTKGPRVAKSPGRRDTGQEGLTSPKARLSQYEKVTPPVAIPVTIVNASGDLEFDLAKTPIEMSRAEEIYAQHEAEEAEKKRKEEEEERKRKEQEAIEAERKRQEEYFKEQKRQQEEYARKQKEQEEEFNRLFNRFVPDSAKKAKMSPPKSPRSQLGGLDWGQSANESNQTTPEFEDLFSKFAKKYTAKQHEEPRASWQSYQAPKSDKISSQHFDNPAVATALETSASNLSLLASRAAEASQRDADLLAQKSEAIRSQEKVSSQEPEEDKSAIPDRFRSFNQDPTPPPQPEPTPVSAPVAHPPAATPIAQAPPVAPEPEPVPAPKPEPVAAPKPEPVAAPEPVLVPAPAPAPAAPVESMRESVSSKRDSTGSSGDIKVRPSFASARNLFQPEAEKPRPMSKSQKAALAAKAEEEAKAKEQAESFSGIPKIPSANSSFSKPASFSEPTPAPTPAPVPAPVPAPAPVPVPAPAPVPVAAVMNPSFRKAEPAPITTTTTSSKAFFSESTDHGSSMDRSSPRSGSSSQGGSRALTPIEFLNTLGGNPTVVDSKPPPPQDRSREGSRTQSPDVSQLFGAFKQEEPAQRPRNPEFDALLGKFMK